MENSLPSDSAGKRREAPTTPGTIKLRNLLKYGPLALAVVFLAVASKDWTNQTGALAIAHSRKVMPPINVSQINGGRWNLADHRGEVVLINFWATWCPPCRQETPGLVKLSNNYRAKGVAILGISLDEGGTEAIQAFVHEFHLPYPVGLVGPESPWASAVESLPTTILVDRDGRVAKTYMGAVRESVFQADIDRLLVEVRSPRSQKSS